MKTILLIEDNTDAILLLTILIKRKNIPLITAENGVDGIKLFSENKNDIDLVLMDLGLPDMDGMTVATEILKIKQINIIIQTAYSDTQHREQLLNLVTDYIIKPIRADNFYKILNKYFFNEE